MAVTVIVEAAAHRALTASALRQRRRDLMGVGVGLGDGGGSDEGGGGDSEDNGELHVELGRWLCSCESRREETRRLDRMKRSEGSRGRFYTYLQQAFDVASILVKLSRGDLSDASAVLGSAPSVGLD